MGVTQSHCEANPEAAKGQQDMQSSDTVRPRVVFRAYSPPLDSTTAVETQ